MGTLPTCPVPTYRYLRSSRLPANTSSSVAWRCWQASPKEHGALARDSEYGEVSARVRRIPGVRPEYSYAACGGLFQPGVVCGIRVQRLSLTIPTHISFNAQSRRPVRPTTRGALVRFTMAGFGLLSHSSPPRPPWRTGHASRLRDGEHPAHPTSTFDREARSALQVAMSRSA